jgi:glycosyltransferase involved in cell wall biosynthesis
MKILFISAEPIRSRQASATHINEIVRGLTSKGHEVTICVTRVMGPYERTSLLRRSAGYLVFWVQTLMRVHQAAVVYARAHPANFPIVATAWLVGVPIIQEINGSYHDIFITHRWLSPFKGFIIALYRFQFRRADALIAVTAGLADWVRGEAPNVPTFTVANGVNCNVFYPERQPVRAVARDYALFFGSLARWHGIETMIAAVENSAWPKDLDLVIIGEGQMSAMVQQASVRNGHSHALSSVPQEKLVGCINAAALGLVPGNTVGGRGKFGLSPLKLYELLACAIPVVVTDFPGQADLVRSLEAGVIVPPDDPAALARAVAALREKSPSRDKMLKVAATIKAEHSWDNRVAEINKILIRVVERGKNEKSLP